MNEKNSGNAWSRLGKIRVPEAPHFEVLDWGLTEYSQAHQAQLEAVDRVLAGKSPGYLIFTQHAPVYTCGLNPDVSEKALLKQGQINGIPVHWTRRGGGMTFHGPGQLVIYPILDLRPRKDLHAFLRLLESSLIETLAQVGLTRLQAQYKGHTGVWCENRKLAAIGLRVSRFVTYHGLALNVHTDLAPLEWIKPCRIEASEGGVTSLARECSPCPRLDDLQVRFARLFRSRFYSEYQGGV